MGMRFKELEMHNFGPYLGTQSLSFGIKRPLMLVHGPNMTGKTSLLNAIRWALYGHALNRFGKPMTLMHLINSEAYESRDWIMSVEVSFEVDGIQYNLERRIQPKDSSIPPRVDNDFEVKLFLRRDGRHLDAGEVQTEINRILPEQTSRFFLFDGELLNEYETLLATADKQATLIKESIEHILGVPALMNAIADLMTHLRDAARRQQNLAKQDHKAQIYAAEAARIESEIATQEKDLAELRVHHEGLERRQNDLDDTLQAVAGIEADVIRLQDLENQVRGLRDEQQRLRQENRDKLTDAWRDIIQPKIQRHLAILEEESNKQINTLQRVGQLQTELRNIEHLLTLGVCPVCGQRQTESSFPGYQTRKNELEDEFAGLEFDQQRLTQASESIRKLREVKPSYAIETVTNNEKRLLRIGVDLADLEWKIDEINDRLKSHDRSEIARNRRTYIEVTKELGILEKAITEKKRVIDGLQDQASRNRANISAVSGPEMQRLNREVQLCEDLTSLFARAIVRLRDDLRKSVEQDATDIFLRLTTDKSYKGLRINEHYGLTIIGADDREVEVRSAGAEQVVALSLIGALNRNAIRQGPIIMDTPFGRLDPKHRENILKFIPTMAEQVTLLVHGGEIDRSRDLEGIKDQIDKEYEINHPSSRRSELVTVGALDTV